VYWVLLYDLADDYLERRATYREEHLARARDAERRGELLFAGALADPPDRAIFVFRCEDPGVVESFARGDPYLGAGLVTGWQVRRWNVAVGPGAVSP